MEPSSPVLCGLGSNYLTASHVSYLTASHVSYLIVSHVSYLIASHVSYLILSHVSYLLLCFFIIDCFAGERGKSYEKRKKGTILR